MTHLACSVDECHHQVEVSDVDADSSISEMLRHLRGITHLLTPDSALAALASVQLVPSPTDESRDMTTDTALDGSPADVGIVRTELMVSTGDLRNALRAVVPHVGPAKDVAILQRVRLYLRGQNILVAATNRYTVGLAAVSVWGNTYDDDGIVFDISPTQVSEILAMFKTPKDQDDDGGDDDLRIRFSDRFMVVTDVAGLFPGKEVTWPRVANEDGYPDLVQLVGKLAATSGSASSASMHTSGKLLKLFAIASTVYDSIVTTEPTSQKQGALVLRIGESFLGAIMPVKPTEEALAEYAGWRAAWDDRLGQVDLGTGELDPILPPAPETAWEPPAAGPGQTSVEDAVDAVLLAQAAELVVRAQLGSPKMLQRKMRVAWAKVDELMVALETHGVVGPQGLAGVETREVLVKMEDLPALLATLQGEPTPA